MGLLKNLTNNVRAMFQSQKITSNMIIDLLNNGYSLMQISSDLYNIPEIRTAINFIAEKVACIPFRHCREDSQGNVETLKDRLDYVLRIRTNPKQGPQIFITQAITQALLYNNSYIMPEWDDVGKLKWLHIMPFTQAQYGFENGKTTIIFSGQYQFYYEDIIHLQRFPTDKGGSIRQATANYIEIINTIESQAVNDSKTSGRIAAVIQTNADLKGDGMKKKLEEFKDLFLTAENTTGFGMIGANYNIQKLDFKSNPLNKELLDDIVTALYQYFGVYPSIIDGSASELTCSQFINSTIKPWSYQIEEEFTYKLFSDTEIYHGNYISGDLIDLEITTIAAKTNLYDKMLYQGVFNRNEVRRRLGEGRKEGLDEYRANLNSVDASKINQYQGVGGEPIGTGEGQTGKADQTTGEGIKTIPAESTA